MRFVQISVLILLSFVANLSTPTAAAAPDGKALANAIRAAGIAIARKADAELKKEVEKYARDNLFGITGTLIPSGEVRYLSGGPHELDGLKGVMLKFRVRARAKIDVGTRKFGVPIVRKIWAVDTEQVWRVIVLPKQGEGGSALVDIRIEQISATAKKERQATTKQAEGFRDAVTEAIRSKLARFTGEQDLRALFDRYIR